MEKIKNLQNYFSKELSWGWGVQQEIVFNFLMEVAKFSKGKIILDAGAGHQRYKPFFKESIYIAMEHPEAGAVNKNIHHFDILGDVKSIPLESDSVDCVLSTSSLEHFKDPEGFFSEAFRILKPGGSLFIHVPFVYPEHEIPFDFQRPTRYGLKRWYEDAGFENVFVKPTSTSIYSVTCFIADSIIEGLGGLRKELNSKGLFSAIKYIYRKSYVRKYLIYYFIGKPVALILPMLLEKIPNENTIFPIGWVSSGKKQGNEQGKLNYNNKLEFLEKNILKNGLHTIQNGIIIDDSH